MQTDNLSTILFTVESVQDIKDADGEFYVQKK